MGEEQERTVTIPAGFAVSKVEGENTIAEGLVIIDSSGNEYVWIPVDGVLWDEGTSLQDVTERGKILLGRYVFKVDGTIDTNLTPTTLGGKLDQLGEPTAAYYTEDATDNGVNSFIQSVRDNGGYYIGRYEAGVENGELDSTDIIEGDSYIAAPNDNWTAYVGNNIQLVSKSKVTPWTHITKNKASDLCQNLYLGISSNLINSYAWDTAILFIQQKGKKENSNSYSVQNGGSTTGEIALTGTGVLVNTGEEDKQCNIYDMAGNCREYTTEIYSQSTQPYASRGGYSSNHDSTRNARIRYGNTPTNIDALLSFRPILYL